MFKNEPSIPGAMQRATLGRVFVAWVLVAAFLMPGIAVAIPTASGVHAGLAATTTKYTSSNWAGYVAVSTNKTVKEVSGAWTQPTVTCGSTTQYAVFWVGMDGVKFWSTLGTVEQIGTFAQCVGGTASYSAWWELYPLNSIVTISSITVKAGDKITASVTFTSSKFVMTIADGTHTFTKKATQSGTLRNSAECIAERPGVSSGGSFSLAHLADFGKMTFSSCTATISGVSGGIGTFANVWELTMVSQLAGNATLAKPSVLNSTKSSFSVTWKKAN